MASAVCLLLATALGGAGRPRPALKLHMSTDHMLPYRRHVSSGLHWLFPPKILVAQTAIHAFTC
eukprot:7379675-Prymnesium_polylepis.1